MNRRTILMVLTSMFAAGSVLWMQRKFEAGDERNALGVVQAYRPKHVSIPDLIGAEHPGRPIEWTTATESACFQHVRVHAVVEQAGAPPTLYAFTVDINGPAIHPANEAGGRVLERLGSSPPIAPSNTAESSSAAASSNASASPSVAGSSSASVSAARPRER